MDTLTELMHEIEVSHKYSEFTVTKSGNILIAGKEFASDQVHIIKTYRFEGDSDPADNVIVYIIEAIDGSLAFSLDAYGTYTNHFNDGYGDVLKQIPTLLHQSLNGVPVTKGILTAVNLKNVTKDLRQLRSCLDEAKRITEGIKNSNEFLLHENEELLALNKELQSIYDTQQCTNTRLHFTNKELEQSKAELGKKVNTLENINSELDNFVLVASHDLLAPLSNIEFSISLINKIEVVDPELKEYLDIINSSVAKFKELIKDIAAVAKVEADMPFTEMVSIDEVLDSIEWSLSSKINDAHALVKRSCLVKHILFSRKNLRSIMYNLISNGIKFKNHRRPVISITTKQQGDTILLTVEDNGIGIRKENMGKIFDMYGRLHQDIEGQGIGLYLAKKIITAAGGNIKVQSKYGKGCKFLVTILAA